MLCFFAAAKSATKSATEPAVDDDRWMYEGAKVSQHVASQTRDLPLAQGMMVSPSGRFSSDRLSPCGSRIAGMFAAECKILYRFLYPRAFSKRGTIQSKFTIIQKNYNSTHSLY